MKVFIFSLFLLISDHQAALQYSKCKQFITWISAIFFQQHNVISFNALFKSRFAMVRIYSGLAILKYSLDTFLHYSRTYCIIVLKKLCRQKAPTLIRLYYHCNLHTRPFCKNPKKNSFIKRHLLTSPHQIYFFWSNHNIHKSSSGVCFWASDSLIDGFY